MTETAPPTTAFPAASGVGDANPEVYPSSGLGARPHKSERATGPDVKPEAPRRHPIAYVALALSVISLLWLAILSSSTGGDHYQKVRVGSQDCVSVPQDSGPAALYCRTNTLTH